MFLCLFIITLQWESNFIRTISNCVIRTKGTAIAIDITKLDDATGKPVKSPSCCHSADRFSPASSLQIADCQWPGQHLQTSGWVDKWSRRHCHGRSPSFGCFVKQDEAIAFKLRTKSSKDSHKQFLTIPVLWSISHHQDKAGKYFLCLQNNFLQDGVNTPSSFDRNFECCRWAFKLNSMMYIP